MTPDDWLILDIIGGPVIVFLAVLVIAHVIGRIDEGEDEDEESNRD